MYLIDISGFRVHIALNRSLITLLYHPKKILLNDWLVKELQYPFSFYYKVTQFFFSATCWRSKPPTPALLARFPLRFLISREEGMYNLLVHKMTKPVDSKVRTKIIFQCTMPNNFLHFSLSNAAAGKTQQFYLKRHHSS